MNVLLEHEVMQPTLLPAVDLAQCTKLPRCLAEHKYAIWGPTCDGTDRVSPGVTFQSEVHVGDWLKYEHMGGKPHCWFIVSNRPIRFRFNLG
jgi:diaminopimelate decarboxylase